MLYWTLKKTRSKQWEVRRKAAEKLGNSGDPSAVEPLIVLLQDRKLSVTIEAASALGKIGDPRAVKPMLELIHHQYRSVRRSVARALGKIGDPRAVEPLLEILEDTDTSVSVAAAKALGKIGDTSALSALESVAVDREVIDEVRMAAELALASITSSTNTNTKTVTGDERLSVDTFTVSATAGDHGTISPSGQVVVEHGESMRFAISPDQFCHVENVLVNDESVGAVTEYTFQNVLSHHTLKERASYLMPICLDWGQEAFLPCLSLLLVDLRASVAFIRADTAS